MIQVSEKWTEYAKENASFLPEGSLSYREGAAVLEMPLTAEDFMEGSVSFTDSISSLEELSVGSVITNTCSFTLNNQSGKFTNIKEWVGISLCWRACYEDGTSEVIARGEYLLDTPSIIGTTIACEGFDNMDILNKPFTDQIMDMNHGMLEIMDIEYPIDADVLLQGLVQFCGGLYSTIRVIWESEIPLDSIQAFEYSEGTTCRDVVGWVAQMLGSYVRADNYGDLVVKPFLSNIWSGSADADGGTIDPWNTGASVDGGTIWSGGDTLEGGNIAGDAIELVGIKTASVEQETQRIGKICVTKYNAGMVTAEQGTGYPLFIANNPLIRTNTMANHVKNYVYNQMVDESGFYFTPFDITVFGNPAIEAGDLVIVSDYLGNKHFSIITDLTYSVGNMELHCDALPPREQNLDMGDAETQIVSRSVNAAVEEVKKSMDYVLEEEINTSGWSYRKWANGFLECWYKEVMQVTIDTARGALYRTALALGDSAYPVEFTLTPTVVATVNANSGDGWGGCARDGSKTTMHTMYAYSAVSGVHNLTVQIYATGKWK